MSISFNEVPKNLRVPFVYVEFDNSRAVSGPALMPYRNLVFGQRLAAGTLAALTPVRVTSAAQAREYFGKGSMLADMLAAQLSANNLTETWAVALDDDAAASAASGTITVAGATGAGTINLYIAPFYEGSILRGRVRVGVTAAMTINTVASAIAAAINADPLLPVTATVADAVVTLTARNKGEAGNGIPVCINHFDGEALPENLQLTFTGGALAGSPTAPYCWAGSAAGVCAYYGNIDPARPFQTLELPGILPPRQNMKGMTLTGGTGNPDISPIWAVLGDTHYNVMTCPYTDASNLTGLELELEDRRGPMRQIEAVCFAAASGTLSALGTLGDSRNSPDLCIMGTGGLFTMQERNLLLYDGIATYSVDSGGAVRVERLITTYTLSPNGAEDISYLDVNTMLTLGYLRYDFRNYILRKYPRHKLAADGTRFGVGQAVITPKIGRAEAVARFRVWEDLGLVEGIDQFKNDLICERNAADPNRLDWMLSPDLVNQFRVGGVQIGFLL
jgi:phage tail sheath gpL-like